MKNANVFIDVDLTLVDQNRKLLAGAREALLRLRDEGCHLFLWSTCGPEYCRQIAALHGLTEFFEGFTAKPDIIIDDMPSTCVTQLVYDVRQEQSWPALAERIIEKHVD
jgi:phosphoglycolate phosphatase-like HAD superfamily hydrolase